MRIQTNVSALNALRNSQATDKAVATQIERLSSGFRLNHASDDAAGMSIANSLRSTGKAMGQAQKNAEQAGSVLQIADGAVQTISTILDRMTELATESASDNVTDTDRTKIQSEFSSLQSEIDRIVNGTSYQGTTLLNGSFGVKDNGTGTLNAVAAVTNIALNGAQAGTYTLGTLTGGAITLSTGAGATLVTQAVAVAAGSAGTTQHLNFDKLGVSFDVAGVVGTSIDAKTIVAAGSGGSFRIGAGASSDSDNKIAVSLADLRTASSGLNIASDSVSTNTLATTALTDLKAAVATLNTAIGTIGAAQNRLTYASSALAVQYQNTVAAESTIRDADMAAEYTTFSKEQVLQQAGTSMLAQANSSNQSVLQLLKG